MKILILWTLIFLCLIVVWISRSSYLTYKFEVERAKSKYEIEMKKGPAEIPEGKLPAPVSAPAKESTDILSWAIKICTVLSGVKTLLEIIERLKPKRTETTTVSAVVPKSSKVTIIIETLTQKVVNLLMSPFRLFKK